MFLANIFCARDVFPDGIKTYEKERDGVVDREVGLETQTQPQGPPKIDNP